MPLHTIFYQEFASPLLLPFILKKQRTFVLVTLVQCSGEFGVLVERILNVTLSQKSVPWITITTTPIQLQATPFSLSFCAFLCLLPLFYDFFLYLATENRKEGEKCIPDSLLVLCVPVILVYDGSIVITNQHEQAAPIPGLQKTSSLLSRSKGKFIFGGNKICNLFMFYIQG